MIIDISGITLLRCLSLFIGAGTDWARLTVTTTNFW